MNCTKPMGLLGGEVGLEKHTPPPPKEKDLAVGKKYNFQKAFTQMIGKCTFSIVTFSM